MSSELAMTARCSHCQKLFAGPSLVIVGQNVNYTNNRLIQFQQKLADHVMNEHKELAQQIELADLEYKGLMILSCYQTTDKALQQQMDLLRWKLHQRTLTTRYTDNMIEQWSDSVVPQLVTLVDMRDTATVRKNLIGMLQSMRDTLEEPNKYTFNAVEPPVPTGKVS